MPSGQIWSDLILADKILKIWISIIGNNRPVSIEHAIIAM